MGGLSPELRANKLPKYLLELIYMRTIIFEGIATSGKTSVEKHLSVLLESKKMSYLLVDEAATLLPILNNKSVEKSLEFLKKSISFAFEQKKDVYIFDRLHLTHSLRTQTDLQAFKEIENELNGHNPIIIFLKIDEDKIPERVSWALNNRAASWIRHAKTYGSNSQIIEHYIAQQRELQETIGSSLLPSVIIDTSSLNFKGIAETIYRDYCAQ